MYEDNDFLKSYKNKEDDVNGVKQAPTDDAAKNLEQKSKAPENVYQKKESSMEYKEKATFSRPRNYSSSNTPSGGGNNTLKKMALASLITFVAAIIIIILLFGNFNKTEVIDFTSWTKNDFLLWSSENEVIPQINEMYNDSIQSNLIISQETIAGAKIKKGDFLKVTVSLGPDLSKEYPIPDFINMTNQEIEQWATTNSMTKVRMSSEFSDTIALGNVIKFEINDDTVINSVKRDSPIYIIISKGAQEKTAVEIVIPDFKTLGVTDSIIFAQENGLNMKIVERYDDYVPANVIISQSTAKDEKAHPGDEVTLTVSLGQKRIMPSFTYLSKTDAMSKAAQLGINLTIKERYSSSSIGRMIWQSIDEGEEITDDTKLQLNYSLGPKIAVGNYVGAQKFNMDEFLEKENNYKARLTLSTAYTQNEAPAGMILQQSPKDAYVYRDTIIYITVSSGQIVYAPDFVAPDDSGYGIAVTRNMAEVMANEVGIILVFVSENKVNRLPGEIWDQSVSAGTEIKVGATLTLKYNPNNSTVLIPNFIGLLESEAKDEDEFINLDITFVTDETATGDSGKVCAQSIAENTTVAHGTELTLTLIP